ncbi:hydrolase [Enterococcus sp. LJL90]
MTSFTRRNPEEDHLLTPENSVVLIIDYQPVQVNAVNSINHHDLLKNAGLLAKFAKAYDVPIILSTVNVATGRDADTVAPLNEILKDEISYDRTSINAWEDKEFYEAVKNSGRKKIIIAALWTEACLTFPTLDALKEGYEVYPVVDAIGGTSTLAHEAALRRVEQAGAQLTSLSQLACEWQRDWNRDATVPDFMKLMFEGDFFFRM